MDSESLEKSKTSTQNVTTSYRPPMVDHFFETNSIHESNQTPNTLSLSSHNGIPSYGYSKTRYHTSGHNRYLPSLNLSSLNSHINSKSSAMDNINPLTSTTSFSGQMSPTHFYKRMTRDMRNGKIPVSKIIFIVSALFISVLLFVITISFSSSESTTNQNKSGNNPILTTTSISATHVNTTGKSVALEAPVLKAVQIEVLSEMKFRAFLESKRPIFKGSGDYSLLTTTNKVTNRLIISKKLMTTYCAVPKVASSNWKFLFRKFAGVTSYSNLAMAHDRKKSGLKYLSDLEFDEIEEWMQNTNNFKFLFVRNPYTRILSCYLNKIVDKQLDDPEYTGYLQQLGISLKQNKPTFREFVGAVQRQSKTAMNEHWALQSTLCETSTIVYDFIGRYETLELDSAAVLRKLGFSGQEVFPSQKQINFLGSGASSRVSEFYTQELKDLVYQVWREDFDQFGYEYNSITV